MLGATVRITGDWTEPTRRARLLETVSGLRSTGVMRYQRSSVPEAHVLPGDISAALATRAHERGEAALDTETSGLDWAKDLICTVQVYVPGAWVEIVRIDRTQPPTHLAGLVSNPTVDKVFHYAVFDLLFLSNVLDVVPRSVVCTKIAAKLLYPGDHKAQRLTSLTGRYLGRPLDKTMQVSDWDAAELSAEQIAYAAEDVLHLPQLREALEKDLSEHGLLELAHACWAHIPTRVELERRSLGDVFTY
jgi:ribonuclease D